jgi:hypothetical protein
MQRADTVENNDPLGCNNLIGKILIIMWVPPSSLAELAEK